MVTAVDGFVLFQEDVVKKASDFSRTVTENLPTLGLGQLDFVVLSFDRIEGDVFRQAGEFEEAAGGLNPTSRTRVSNRCFSAPRDNTACATCGMERKRIPYKKAALDAGPLRPISHSF